MRTFLFVYLGALVVALVTTPIVVRTARRFNLMDMPGIRKIHARAIPRIGGVAVVVAMLSLSIPMLAMDNPIGQAFRKIQVQVVALLAAGFMMFVVGLIDDVWDLRVRIKFLAQIAAALVLCAVGVRIDEVSIDGWVTIRLYQWSWPVTVFWIVGITNAVNLIDGLDGLAAGIAAVTCGVIAVFALYTGQPVMAVLMLALLGSLCGFLFYNFNPALIFLGDCGTMFLGFVLAASSVMCVEKSPTLVALALPALALGVPIFDTFFSILRRFEERRSIFAPDRGHIHHRLLDKGLRHRHVVILMYLVTLTAAGLGMFMMVTRDVKSLAVFGLVVALLLLVFRIVGAVHFRDSILAIQRNLAIARQARQDKRIFEMASLRVREARTLQTWWQAVCTGAGDMNFLQVALSLTRRDGTEHTLMWHRDPPESGTHERISLVIPVRDRREGQPLRMEVVVHINGSLEAAGRRVAHFSRLIDENGLASLPPVVPDDRRQKIYPPVAGGVPAAFEQPGPGDSAIAASLPQGQAVELRV